jgi:dipeptidyl aminopeptidase/acylaminoacyl peptidase
MDALTPELVLKLRRPSDVALSADGSRITFAVSASSREQGKPIETRLWAGEVDGELEPGELGSLPRFSPDGSRLAFASDLGHEGRLSLRVDDRELGEIPGSVEDIHWSPDGARLLVLAADLGADRAGADSATKIEEAGAEAQDPKVFRPAKFWRRLWLVDAATGDTQDVTPESVNVFELGWAGGKVAAVCSDEPSESAWYDAWLGLIDLEGRSVERVHTPKWQLQAPRISPGGRVAFVEGLSSDRGTLTGTVHVLGVGPIAPELDATWIDFADEETLWVAGWRGAGSFAGRLSLDGSFEELAGGDLTLGTHYAPKVAVGAGGSRVAAVLESADEPPEVVLWQDGKRLPVTSLNAEIAPGLAALDWRTHRWKSSDGLEIEGLLALPRDRGNGPLPLVVLVHGGPTGCWSWMFAPAYGLSQIFAAAGYATLLPNVRGSVGRGPEFAEANLGDMGGGDLQDILTGIDSLVRDGIVDDARVAIAGGSYGGFMSSWAVTQTDRFAAAIPFAVVTNWVSFHATTNIGQFDRLFLQADPYDAEGDYTQRSPVYHASKCRTPTLIIHGEDDLCTPLPQAVEFYNALVEAGCETELVVYPREGHGWTEREHVLDSWNRMRDWLAQHL